MAIVGAATQPKPVFLEYTALSEVGTGLLGALPGFSAATQGFTAGPFLSMPYGTQIIVRNATDSYFFIVGEGTGGKVAVLVATLSAGASASITGATLKYVVYPDAGNFNLPPTNVFTTIGSAITAANTENAANSVSIIIAPGPYSESITVRNQMSLVGLGVHDETGNSGVRLTGDNVTAAITVPQSTVCSIENMRVDGNTQSAVLFADVAGATRFQTEGCTFASTNANTLDGSGTNSVVTAVLTNTQVTGRVNYGNSGTTTLRGCSVSGKVDCLTLDASDCVIGGEMTAAGTATVRGCNGLTLAAAVTIVSDSTLTNFASGGVGSSFRRCAIRNIILTGAGASVVDSCTINCSASAATVGINVGVGHTVTIIGTEVTTDGTANALGGAGSAVIYGGLPGTGLIDSATTVTAVSGHAVLLGVDVTPVASPTTNPWPASNPDRVRFTPFDTTAANNVLVLPASNTQVPGRELLVRNVSSVNFGQLQASGGDSLFDGTTNAAINLPPGDYRRVICRRGVGWEVN